MNTKEIIGWLKIIRTDLKNFPEISNGKKIEALTASIDIIEAYEAFIDPSVSDKASYKKFEKICGFQDEKDKLEQEPILDNLRAEITTLQHRCYALTKGVVCAFCKYECEYKKESEKEEIK